jgi:hypothetical protein
MPFTNLIIIVFYLTVTPFLPAQSYEGELSYSVQDIKFEERSGFDFLYMKGAGYIPDPGKPCLPCMKINVALPSGADPLNVKVLETETELIEGNYDVMPCAKPLRFSDVPLDDPYWKDPETYHLNAYYPQQSVELCNKWDLAGQEFVTLMVYPVHYNPALEKLRVDRKIRFEVTWEEQGLQAQETYNFSPRIKSYYRDLLRKMAVNPEAVKEPSSREKSSSRAGSPLGFGHYDYVILVPDKHWHYFFQKLADWRTQMGMRACLVDLNWIYANYPDNGNPTTSLQDRIRNFIIDANATWGSLYFLLGGDAAYVPYHTRVMLDDLIPNDTYYADFDDDKVCEVYVGRACVNNDSQVAFFVNKVLNYEKAPPRDYGRRAFFMGFILDGITTGEDTKDSIHEDWFPDSMVLQTEYDSEPGAHKSDVLDYLNKGPNLVNHIDHATPYRMGVGSRKHDDWLDVVEPECTSFSNGTRYFNIYSIGCLTARFTTPLCYVEELLRDKYGAITHVGNTSYGWYYQGNPYSLSGWYDICWWQALHDLEAYRAGETLAISKNLGFQPLHPPCSYYLFTGLILLGDPGLHLWTAEPCYLDVLYRSVISTGPQNFIIKVKTDQGVPVEGALACLMNGREVYAVGTTDASGLAKIYINPMKEWPITVTVTGRNCRCHEGTVEVTIP